MSQKIFFVICNVTKMAAKIKEKKNGRKIYFIALGGEFFRPLCIQFFKK